MIVYKIVNDINDKVYIGRTKKSLAVRWCGHMKCLRRGDNRHLYCAMRKYGVEHFHIEKICDCESMEEMYRLEAYYTELYDSYNSGYNMTTAGEINPMDCKQSRESHDEKMRTAEVRNRISETMKKVRASQKDYITIHNEIKQRRIPEDQIEVFLNEGWQLGTLKARRCMYNSELNIQKLIPQALVNQYLSEGWIFKKVFKNKSTHQVLQKNSSKKVSKPADTIKHKISEIPESSIRTITEVKDSPACLNPNNNTSAKVTNKYVRKGGDVKYNTTDAFKVEQSARLKKFYTEHPDYETRSKKAVCITNPETNESLYFQSCISAAKALGLPEYCAKAGYFKRWVEKDCISYKKSNVNGWKICFINN